MNANRFVLVLFVGGSGGYFLASPGSLPVIGSMVSVPFFLFSLYECFFILCQWNVVLTRLPLFLYNFSLCMGERPMTEAWTHGSVQRSAWGSGLH